MQKSDAIPGVRVNLRELVALYASVPQLSKLAARRSSDAMTGGHQSPFRGRGMEYAESRPYAVGDDVRHIDWRVTARSGKTHTKLFQPERERTTAIIYDSAATMAFGTRTCFKSVQAARLAALMLWLCAQEGHRLAAARFNNHLELVSPMAGRRGVLRILDALVRWQPELSKASDSIDSGGNLLKAIDSLRRVLRPGSQILLLLDPRSVSEAMILALARLRGHNDVAVMLLVDPIEQAPPPPASYRISNGNVQGILHLESRETRQRWQQHFAHMHSELTLRLRRVGAKVSTVTTDADPVQALAELLRGASTELHEFKEAK